MFNDYWYYKLVDIIKIFWDLIHEILVRNIKISNIKIDIFVETTFPFQNSNTFKLNERHLDIYFKNEQYFKINIKNGEKSF